MLLVTQGADRKDDPQAGTEIVRKISRTEKSGSRGIVPFSYTMVKETAAYTDARGLLRFFLRIVPCIKTLHKTSI